MVLFLSWGAVVTFLFKIMTLGDFTIEYISNVKYGQIYSQKELDKLIGRAPRYGVNDVVLKPLEWKALKELNDMLGKELLEEN
jgi:hypothetical protein